MVKDAAGSEARCSIPACLENDNLLGGHWDLSFSHPVYYLERAASQSS
jgi:hypothetical protein